MKYFKQYLLRLVAAIPMLAAGLAALAAFIIAIDIHIVALFGIALSYSFAVCAVNYEKSVVELRNFLKVLCDTTLSYGE